MTLVCTATEGSVGALLAVPFGLGADMDEADCVGGEGYEVWRDEAPKWLIHGEKGVVSLLCADEVKGADDGSDRLASRLVDGEGSLILENSSSSCKSNRGGCGP